MPDAGIFIVPFVKQAFEKGSMRSFYIALNIHCGCHNMLTVVGAEPHKEVTILSMNRSQAQNREV
jgi:hypothetical protein